MAEAKDRWLSEAQCDARYSTVDDHDTVQAALDAAQEQIATLTTGLAALQAAVKGV